MTAYYQPGKNRVEKMVLTYYSLLGTREKEGHLKDLLFSSTYVQD